MANGEAHVPMGNGQGGDDSSSENTPADDANLATKISWRSRARLSSIGDGAEQFLRSAGFDRGPWLVIAFAGGIGAWFLLGEAWEWAALLLLCAVGAVAVFFAWKDNSARVLLRQAVMAVCLTVGFGVLVIWGRSEIVGAEPIGYTELPVFNATILERDEQPALKRVRLILAMRDAESGDARKVRVNIPIDQDRAEMIEGATIRLRSRLMPPSPPMLPGGYNFARAAWFQGLAATGASLGEVKVLQASPQAKPLAEAQRSLAAHIRGELSGSSGSIAAALASGDRGAISEADEEAMRDSGLTHLLSISGLHVSAVIAAAYFIAIKLLALWPALTLRVRLPVLAAAISALAGLGYTLLTGAEVPTVRSCVGAILVLIAMSIGREPLSLRMVAAAAAFVLFLWPESLVGPSFQMSFTAVIAIVALHNSAPARAFLAPREESGLRRFSRRAVMLLITGLVIEFALMPIVLFHFHRAGFYGAGANMIGIPLTTFVIMPLIALALVFDIVGLGSPIWWLAGKSLDLLIGVAHFTASLPGAVKLAPEMGLGIFSFFLMGGLWLGLWKGKMRLLGFVPVALATLLMVIKPAPDILVSSDGRNVGIAGEGDRLIVLRKGRGGYSRDKLLELAGMNGQVIGVEDWPGARCSRDFCNLTLRREGRDWQILMARSRDAVEELALAAACDRADIVIADRYLPRSCKPRWLKADRRMLTETGGLSLYLEEEDYDSVSQSQGRHGWWQGGG